MSDHQQATEPGAYKPPDRKRQIERTWIAIHGFLAEVSDAMGEPFSIAVLKNEGEPAELAISFGEYAVRDGWRIADRRRGRKRVRP